jgi:hypothetical protein
MEFRLLKDRNRSVRKTIEFSGSAVLFGFPSSIRHLNLVLNRKGKKSKYSISDTEVGFAVNDIEGRYQVWFEYDSADKNYKIDLMTD